MICEKHGCVQNEFVECPGCVREERDRLQHELTDEKANSESWRQQHENRVEDMLRISKELDGMRDERDRLRDLIPQAWDAAQKCMTLNRSMVGTPSNTCKEWMKQKGLS